MEAKIKTFLSFFEKEKSSILQLKQGDKSIYFFHRMANAHKRFKTLHRELELLRILTRGTFVQILLPLKKWLLSNYIWNGD